MTPDNDGRISLKDHFDSLRAADEKLHEALRAADKELQEAIHVGELALQAERDRSTEQLETTKETALAAALLTVKEKNEGAVAELARAAQVLAGQTRADKEAANEWRGTVNDIISKMGGAKIMWGVIAGLAALGFMIWNSTRNSRQSAPAPIPVKVEQPSNIPVPVKEVP